VSPPCDFQLRLLLYSFARIDVWSFKNLSTPYWRFYWNEDSGASIRLREHVYHLGPDTVFLIPPDTPFATALDHPLRHFFVHFTIQSPYSAFLPGVHSSPLSTDVGERIALVCRRLAQGRTGPYLDVVVNGIVSETLLRLPEELWPATAVDPRIARVVDHLKTTLERQPGNDELAAMAGMSTNGFIRLFSQQTGASPRAFSLRLRLDHACILLHHSDMKIDEIAETCGFWDRNYFTKMFRKYKFTTPGMFRKQRSGGIK